MTDLYVLSSEFEKRDIVRCEKCGEYMSDLEYQTHQCSTTGGKVMKEKLRKLTDAGYKVMIRTRWTDDAWDVWIYKTDHNIIEKQRPSFAWNEDIEKALDEATLKIVE